MKLQIENSEQLIYENDILQLTILGGIKLEGLDRMRVTGYANKNYTNKTDKLKV